MILITGASGFLGSHLANYAVNRGRRVRGLVRPTSDLSALDTRRIPICQGDLLDPVSLRAALAPPVLCVVHCAATTSETKVDHAESLRVNVQGTKNLIEACHQQGVERFIMISTQSANKLNPSTYAQSKLAGDVLVEQSKLAYTILKPSTIYGAGSKGLFAKMVRLLDTLPLIPVLGPGGRLIRPIYVFDLCEAILQCESSPNTLHKTYDLGGRDLVSYEDFVRSILQMRRIKKPLVHIPLPVCHILAATFGILKNPPFTRDNVLGLNQNQTCNIAAARNDFGFQPVDLREGLRQTFSTCEHELLAQTRNDNRSRGEPQKVAVVGLGKMGILHASILNILPSVRIIGVVDQNKGLAGHVRSMGLQVPFYESVGRLLSEQQVDAAFVCTPAFTHYPLVRQLVERNVNVFVEKPLAECFDSAIKMCELVKDQPTIHAVGYMKGHYPLYEKAHELVHRGALGKVSVFRSTLYLSQVFAPRRGWVYEPERSGGGVVANSTCHLLFLLYWLFGEPRSICARMRSLYSEQVEDAAMALLEFDNGVVGTLDTSWSTPGYPVEQTEILVQGSGGALEMSDTRLRLYLNQNSGEYEKGWTTWHRASVDKAPFDLSPQYAGEGYYNEDVDFIQACQRRGRPRVSWIDGLKVQKMMDALYRSASEGCIRL